MSDCNLNKILYCKFCNKICKNKNSLAQHEIRCKLNPNKISLNNKGNGFKKNQYKWINNGSKSMMVKSACIDKYLSEGWLIGFDNDYKQKLSNSVKNSIKNNTGRARSEQKEIERRQKISIAMKGNENWKFNKKRGVGKSGWYKGIYCDSSWELAFVMYHLDNNLSIRRCNERRKYIYNNIERIYIPDFITDDGIIEIKGYKTQQWISKIEQNPDIIVLYEHDMKKYIDYAIEKYGKDYTKYYE